MSNKRKLLTGIVLVVIPVLMALYILPFEILLIMFVTAASIVSITVGMNLIEKGVSDE